MIHFRNGTVTVDDHFVRTDRSSYAIEKINTVQVRTTAPYGRGGYAALVIVALLSAIVAIAARSGWAAIITLGAAAWAWRLRRRSQLRDHTVVLTTSSGEASAYTSRDEIEIMELRATIEGVMTGELPSRAARRPEIILTPLPRD